MADLPLKRYGVRLPTRYECLRLLQAFLQVWTLLPFDWPGWDNVTPMHVPRSHIILAQSHTIHVCLPAVWRKIKTQQKIFLKKYIDMPSMSFINDFRNCSCNSCYQGKSFSTVTFLCHTIFYKDRLCDSLQCHSSNDCPDTEEIWILCHQQ